MAAVPPELMAQFLPEICASMNPDELSLMLGGMKAMAPPEMFAGAARVAEQATPPQNWEKVRPRIAQTLRWSPRTLGSSAPSCPSRAAIVRSDRPPRI